MFPSPIMNKYGNIIQYDTIVDMQASASHSLILTSSGNLYGRGSGTYNVLNNGSVSTTSLVLVQSGVSAMYCGPSFTLYVKNSVLYRLGVGLTYASGTVSTPTVISTSFNAGSIKKIQCCSTTSIMVLLNDGTMYYMGAGTNNRFGTGSTSTISTFTLSTQNNVKDMYHKSSRFEGSSCNTIILKNDGTVYGCGSVALNAGSSAFSFSTYQSTSWFQRTASSTIQGIMSSGNSCLFLDNASNLYGDGNSSYEILGNSNTVIYNSLIQSSVLHFGLTIESTYYTQISSNNVLHLAGRNFVSTSSFVSTAGNQPFSTYTLSNPVKAIFGTNYEYAQSSTYILMSTDRDIAYGGSSNFGQLGSTGTIQIRVGTISLP